MDDVVTAEGLNIDIATFNDARPATVKNIWVVVVPNAGPESTIYFQVIADGDYQEERFQVPSLDVFQPVFLDD